MFKNLFLSNSKRREIDFFKKIDRIERDVVGRFSRGNLSIQVGNFLSKEELDEERKSYKNSKSK